MAASLHHRALAGCGAADRRSLSTRHSRLSRARAPHAALSTPAAAGDNVCSTSGRLFDASSSRRNSSSRLHCALQEAPSSPDAAAAPSAVSATSLASIEDELTVAPEDFELAPGELSFVDRTSPESPDDVFRCVGCTRPECQVLFVCVR